MLFIDFIEADKNPEGVLYNIITNDGWTNSDLTMEAAQAQSDRIMQAKVTAWKVEETEDSFYPAIVVWVDCNIIDA